MALGSQLRLDAVAVPSEGAPTVSGLRGHKTHVLAGGMWRAPALSVGDRSRSEGPSPGKVRACGAGGLSCELTGDPKKRQAVPAIHLLAAACLFPP